nr:hypothetical protein KXZ65_01430 [Pectobacterium sp. PL152]
MGKKLEEFNPYFYEEPTDTLLINSSLEVKAGVNLSLAGGERLYTRFDFAPFIENRVFELIQPDMGLAGGFTEMKKLPLMRRHIRSRFNRITPQGQS